MTDRVEDFERVSAAIDEIDASIERDGKLLLACVVVTTIVAPIGWFVCLKHNWTPGIVSFPMLVLVSYALLFWSRSIVRRVQADQAERHDYLRKLRN
jgi:hypothetical protein